MTIWLTGCTSGLGRALVPEFLKAGHTVIGCGRNEIALQRLREELPDGSYFSVDVASDDSCRQFCDAALAKAGAPDLVINNAAIVNEPMPLWEMPAEDFDELTAININGVANIIRHALPSMIAQSKGVIVNLSSGWGRSTSPEVAPYCASKWAIEGLTQALAQELPPGLATVALNPGIIATDMLRRCWGSGADSYQSSEAWATTAAPFLTALSADDNGKSLTAP